MAKTIKDIIEENVTNGNGYETNGELLQLRYFYQLLERVAQSLQNRYEMKVGLVRAETKLVAEIAISRVKDKANDYLNRINAERKTEAALILLSIYARHNERVQVHNPYDRDAEKLRTLQALADCVKEDPHFKVEDCIHKPWFV